jgi:hypothetical protein
MIQVFVDDRDAQRRLARIQGRFAERKGGLSRGIIDELEAKFVRFASQQFATDGAHGGQTWAPLSARTLADKARRGTVSRGILRDSMEMYRMLTDRKSDKRIWENTPGGARVRFLVPYFRFHQDSQRDAMPSRPVYPDPLPPSLVNEIKNTITGYILEGSFA